jgi:two-component system, cell cycle sensor histidine kinase and response regulator CckA
MTDTTPDLQVTRSRTILVAEDDAICLRVLSRALEDHGYRVLTATNGINALHQFGDSDNSIDLLITDFFMPDLNGRELAQKVERLSPKTRILYMTGYMNRLLHLVPHDEEWPNDVMHKPIAPETLYEVVEATLSVQPKTEC